MRRLLLSPLSNELTCCIVGDTRCCSTVSNQTQIRIARHELLMLLMSSAMWACTGDDVIHHALQFAMHQWVLWWMRLKWVGVKAMWLIGCGVELSVEETCRQYRINWAIAGTIATVTAISVLILIKVLVATIRTAQVGCVWCQQIILHRRLSLRRVAKTSRTILACVQVVVIVASVIVRVVSEEIVGRAISAERRVVVVCSHIACIHECLMAHLRLRWRRTDETGQMLIEFGCCWVRQHYRRLNLVESHKVVACFVLTWNALACASKVLRCFCRWAGEAQSWIVELSCRWCCAGAGETATRQVGRIGWGWTVTPMCCVAGTQAELWHVCLEMKK